MPLPLWLSEAAVLATGVNLGLTFLGYVRAVRMLREALVDPGLEVLVPRLERTVNVHRFALAFLSMAWLIIIRVHLSNLGVYPLVLPAD
jgi:hypothetical protein